MRDSVGYRKKNLALLDSVKNNIISEEFNNTLIIACHHILENNLFLMDYLIRLGIKPENVFLMGKSYSTSKQLIKAYSSLGIKVHDNSMAFDSHVSFDEQFSNYIRNFLEDIKKNDLSKYRKILILDDGGELLTQANEYFKEDTRVIGVEQTSSGYQKIKRLNLNFPIINVATSRAKLEYESPMIAEAIIKELYKRFSQMDKKLRNILIMGNGPIGASIAKALKEEYEVFIYDSDKKRTMISDGTLEKILPICDVIIGCSGKNSIAESKHPYLKKGVILVSASSSDREFESHKIRKKHERTSNTHKDFCTEDVVLLNGGFPLNFDGYKSNVPLEDIQLTSALMLSAAIQAITHSYEKQIIDLNNPAQELIIDRFKELQ